MNNYGKRLSQSLFYWIIYSYLLPLFRIYQCFQLSQSLFYWIIYSYSFLQFLLLDILACLNPYFIGLSILMVYCPEAQELGEIVSILILLDYLFLFSSLDTVVPVGSLSQSLFYWIIYSYLFNYVLEEYSEYRLNPYFIGLSILIRKDLKTSSSLIVSQSLFYWIIYSYLM